MQIYSDIHYYPDIVGINEPPVYSKQYVNSYSHIDIKVHSTCEQPIFWKNQMGFNCVQTKIEPGFVPGQFYVSQPEVVSIIMSIQIGPHARFDIDELLSELKVWYPNYGSDKINTLVQTHDVRPGIHNPSLGIDPRHYFINLTIPAECIREHNGIVYVPQVGLVIGFADCIDKAKHPLTPNWFRKELNQSVMEVPDTQLRILAVDNSGEKHTFWYNSGFKIDKQAIVIPIKTIQNQQLKSGFYVTYLDIHGHYQTKVLSLEEGFEQLGIYRSRDEAQRYGNPKVRYAEELLRMEADNNKIKLELSIQKTELEKIQLDNNRLKFKEELRKRKEERIDEENKRETDRLEREYRLECLRYEKLIKEKDDALKLKEMEYRQLELDSKAKIAHSKKITDIMKTIGDTFKALVGLSAVATFVVTLFKRFFISQTAS